MVINDFIIKNNLSVLLDKIKNNINVELNFNLLLYFINKYNLTVEKFVIYIKEIIDKDTDFANKLANYFIDFNYDYFALGILQYIYLINKNNEEIENNLIKLLNKLGEYELVKTLL